MHILDSINIINLIIAFIFIIPIFVGMIKSLTPSIIHRSFVSVLNYINLMVAILVSIYLTNIIIFGNQNAVLDSIYKLAPKLRIYIESKESWVYFVSIIIFLILTDGVLYLITYPVYTYFIVPISDKLTDAVCSMKSIYRRIIGGLWRLPKSISFVLIFALILNFYSITFMDSSINEDANDSALNQLVQQNVIQPLLNNNVIKDINIIVNDSFKTLQDELPSKLQLLKYFNGTNLGSATKSNEEIDAKAREVIASETNDKKKAYLIYKWISKNIKYDNKKAEQIVKDPTQVNSGAIVAYNTKTGVCFDYACLYIAMCKAVGLKVRFVTGLGYTGSDWGDHAWNQVYYQDENIWINVDATFGSTGINYFNKSNFYNDHTQGIVHGEW